MRYFNNISGALKTLLIVIAAVVFLSACGDKKDSMVIGGACTSDRTEKCVDVSDNDCLSCIILEDLYTAVGYNVSRLYGEFTKGAMAIMMVGFSVWLALRLLKFVSSVTETNIGEVWNEILRKAFICLICGLLASSSGMLNIVINTIIFPIYTAFLELGLQVLGNALAGKEDAPVSFSVFGTLISVENIDMKCEIEGSLGMTANGFPEGIKKAMSCQILMLSRYLTIGGDIALTVMQQTTSLTGSVMGWFLYSFFWIVKIFFVFYLVDTTFRMGIMILLLPLFILSYAFGPTKKWMGIGFSNIIASSAFMMCFSIIVALVLRAMVSLVQENPEIFDPEGLEASMMDISIGFLCLLLIGFLIYGSMGVAQQLTSGLIGGSVDSQFQKNLKAALQGAFSVVKTGLGALFTWGMSLTPQASIKLVRKVGKAYEKASELRAKMQRLAGRK